MKVFWRMPDPLYRHIRCQGRVQGPVEVGEIVSPFDFEADHLPACVHAPVRSPSTNDPYWPPSYCLQCPFNLALDGPIPCLNLKASKVGAVICYFAQSRHVTFGPFSSRRRSVGPDSAATKARAHSTSSRSAIGAASPLRMPSLNIRV
jgi:hypothetical protein